MEECPDLKAMRGYLTGGYAFNGNDADEIVAAMVAMDELKLQNNDLKSRLLMVCEAVEEYVTAIGPERLGAETVAKWKASMAKAMGDFALKPNDVKPLIIYCSTCAATGQEHEESCPQRKARRL